jgi:adenylate kinase
MDSAGKPRSPQVVVVVGPPGAGKGTQCSRAAGAGVVHLSTGDAFRRAIRQAGPLGTRVGDALVSGGLVADDVVLEVVGDAMTDLGPGTVVLLDGFPRTVAQAETLVHRLGGPPALVLELAVSMPVLRARLARRLVCSHCGRSGTSTHAHAPLRPVCECGGTMEPRADDLPEQLERRLRIYEEEQPPVVERLRSLGTPHRVVDGNHAADAVAIAFADALADHTAASRVERDATAAWRVAGPAAPG